MDDEKFEALLRAIDKGNESAFEEIYNFYATKIKAVAFTILSVGRL